MKHALAALIALCTLPTLTQAQDSDMGMEIYRTYCAACHGLNAHGDGPMAPLLVLQPPDLGLITARNGGIFPVARVVMRIDGRAPLASHGSQMPVYGDFFEGNDTILKTETGQPIMTSEPVVDLIAFLRTIQE